MDLARKPGRSERIQLYHVAVVLEYIDLDTTLPPTPQLRRASLIVRVWEALVFKFGGFYFFTACTELLALLVCTVL